MDYGSKEQVRHYFEKIEEQGSKNGQGKGWWV